MVCKGVHVFNQACSQIKHGLVVTTGRPSKLAYSKRKLRALSSITTHFSSSTAVTIFDRALQVIPWNISLANVVSFWICSLTKKGSLKLFQDSPEVSWVNLGMPRTDLYWENRWKIHQLKQPCWVLFEQLFPGLKIQKSHPLMHCSLLCTVVIYKTVSKKTQPPVSSPKYSVSNTF